MAFTAMQNDIDGLSDEKQARGSDKWYERYAKAGMDLFDSTLSDYNTTMREAAKKYLDESGNSNENVINRNNFYKWLSSNTVGEDGKTRKDHIEDFDNLASMVSQDYNILMNPEKYKDLQDYDRLKDVDGLRLSDEEKLQLYAQFYVDLQRGGDRYAM